MKDLQHLVLRFAVEIDQKVAANDQVEPRKRRVAQDIVRGEKDQLAQVFFDPVTVAVSFTKKRFRRPGHTSASIASG